ncbi:TadE/TadG family type IV pilus assembly protein, partial [Sphingomonas sp.]|uniref:TadE/TadG family type IV pilus assembly protein n=1 Tax=Sphingomonas sp. TaxID=28214 RepID=UPI002CF17788
MGKRIIGSSNSGRRPAGLLTRLARDTRGNVLAMVAAALIPLCGMIGGGLDLSRMYIVKTRLQHACDAGALAGRKSMGGGTWAQQGNLPRQMAERFFDANIRQDIYGAESITRSFSEAAGKVTGTASADLPMTLMRVLGKTSAELSVTCESEMRLPNTDVMFVLDVTGSMGERAVSTDAQTKIQGLRTAVLCFYEIVARLDTVATCDGGAPSGGTGQQ